MKRFLAVGLSLTLVLGFAVVALGFNSERVAAPVAQLQDVEANMGTLAPKDLCYIYCDNLAGWVWIWTSTWFGPGCGFYKYIDPNTDPYTTCLPPYFPFKVSRLRPLIHVYDWADTVNNFDCVLEYTISGVMEDPSHPCGFRPGAQIYSSGPLYFSLPAGFYGTASYYTLPGECTWVDGPFFLDWHVLEVEEPGYLGWLTDAYVPYIPCYSWFDLYCYYYYPIMEFAEAGFHGNLLYWVWGYPAWNVAVELASFEAIPGDRSVTLNWRSATEINNASWKILRDGEVIATLNGQGNKETPTDYSYVDRNLTNGVTYSYTLEAQNYEGNVDDFGPITATPMAAGTVPSEFALMQNYPNPFNASTVIRYQVASAEHVTLKVYNVGGQEVATLVDADQKAGYYTVQWNGKDAGSGVYFYTLTAGNFSETKKMVYTK